MSQRWKKRSARHKRQARVQYNGLYIVRDLVASPVTVSAKGLSGSFMVCLRQGHVTSLDGKPLIHSKS